MASRKAQEEVESMFNRGYEQLESRGTHGTRSLVVEGSDHLPNPYCKWASWEMRKFPGGPL